MKKKAFGTYSIAKICHVMPSTVGRWIEEGKLPSFTTGGGHRRVWDTDLLSFLVSHNIPVPSELANSAAQSVLIVDDETVVRKFVRKIVEADFPGTVIHEAEDGFEAGHKVGTLLPSLVVLDIKLPGVDGLRVCQMIRRDKNLSKVKIIAITGLDTKDMKEQALAAGADDFLGKPFNAKDLSEKIKSLLSAPANR